MTVGYILGWLLVFLRSLGVVLQLPVIAGRPLPIVVRVAIGVCLAMLLSGTVPPPVVPQGMWQLVAAAAGEVLVGLALGFVTRMTFAAVEMAGRLISTEVGLNAAPGMGVPDPSTEPLASLLSTFAIVLFFLFGGHLMLLSAFARSFRVVPPGAPILDAAADDTVILLTAKVIELGFRIAAPFIAMNFLVVLAFAVLGRAVPKMNVFIMSFSVRAIAGVLLLSGSGGLIARYLYLEFGELPLRMLQILPGR